MSIMTADHVLNSPIPSLNRGGSIGAAAADDGTYRHYSEVMTRRLGHGNVPTFADILSGALGSLRCDDDLMRSRFFEALERTGTTITGSGGGFGVQAGIFADIVDQARTVLGPWTLCNWEPLTETETCFPISADAALALNSQGIVSSWGVTETSFPAATDDRIARLYLKGNRLLIQTILSRDLAQDSTRILRWLRYRGYRAIRLAIETAMIYGSGVSGTGGFPCPQGVLSFPAMTTVKRSGSTISVVDLDSMMSKLYVGCMRNAVWHIGADAFKVINQLEVSGQNAELLFARPGQATNGVFCTLKGLPVIPLEISPAVGTTGDVILVDWSQYVLGYMRLPSRNSPFGFDSPLTFGFEPPRDKYHQGLVGMPEEAVEARISDQVLFTNDELMVNFKFRGDGAFLWPGTKSTLSSLTVGPAVVLV
jgi:HK97 family phage major capsid protein